MTEADIAQATALYLAGMSQAKIGKKLHYAATTISRNLRLAGVATKRPNPLRAQQARDLRVQHRKMTWDAIALAVGYANGPTARTSVARTLGAVPSRRNLKVRNAA